MSSVAVFDMDNCLCDASLAPGAEAMRLALEHAAKGDTLIICTSRPEADRWLTEQWLRLHGVPFERVLMRPDGDLRSSVKLKPNLLCRAGLLPRNSTRPVACVYDDRRDILDVIAAFGVPTRQVAIVPGLHEGRAG